MSNFGLVFTLQGRGFESICPYYRGHHNATSEANIFRVKNLSEEYKMFTADSFGNHRYIDVAQKRPCSSICGCHILDTYQESYAYTFVVHINYNSLRVQVHSPALQLWLYKTLRSQTTDDQFDRGGMFCGLQLLKHRQHLLRSMENRSHFGDSMNDMLLSEACLLINGLLGDAALFSSFDYETLHKQGYLTYEDLKAFQNDILERDLNVLEDSVDAEPLEFSKLERHHECNHEADEDYHPEWYSLAELKNTWRIGQTHKSLVEWGRPEKLMSISSQLAMLVNSNQRSYLEAELGSPENSLITAAGKGDLARVKMVLRLSARLTGDLDPTTPLIDINAIKRCTTKHYLSFWRNKQGMAQTRTTITEMTALMAAAGSQHYKVVKFLIEQGADVNVVAKSGTALSLADKDGSTVSRRIGELLLRSGADIHVALLLTRQLGKEPVMLNELTKSRGIHNPVYRLNTFSWGGLRARQMLRQVHLSFITEHRTILEAGSQNGPTPLGGRIGWQAGIETNWKNAWKTGIRCLRRLCNGLKLATVNETIMFFAISRAMSHSVKTWDPNYQKSFSDDVVRWQLLFSDYSSLIDYEQAVYDIWGIRFDGCEILSPPDLDAMYSLQEMVKELIHRATNTIGLEDIIEDSFPATKSEWKDRSHTLRDIERMAVITMAGSPMYSTSRQNESHRTSCYQAFPLSQNSDPPLHRNIIEKVTPASTPDVDSSKVPTLLTFLMAGTIFATTISFLLIALHYTENRPSTNRPQQYRQIATHALGHVLSATAVTLKVDQKLFSEARAKTLTQIHNGLVLTYTQLGRVLTSQAIFQKTSNYAQQLRYVLDAWHSTFLAQETYALLSLYLGSVEYRSITPDLPLPNQRVPQEPVVPNHDMMDIFVETENHSMSPPFLGMSSIDTPPLT
ncbi:hypothetical protein EMCG_03513 [[Emmonsia] crescens]|uniref:Uncharacterized protein n=1 Tax=[Emmonsia] crescens TaxID=73230 RepID=A0A0G2J8D7_9EURO|nr:hypothetical protein EMCG_03513 [Emmonsia crescens UAMH 3008]